MSMNMSSSGGSCGAACPHSASKASGAPRTAPFVSTRTCTAIMTFALENYQLVSPYLPHPPAPGRPACTCAHSHTQTLCFVMCTAKQAGGSGRHHTSPLVTNCMLKYTILQTP